MTSFIVLKLKKKKNQRKLIVESDWIGFGNLTITRVDKISKSLLGWLRSDWTLTTLTQSTWSDLRAVFDRIASGGNRKWLAVEILHQVGNLIGLNRHVMSNELGEQLGNSQQREKAFECIQCIEFHSTST